MAMKRALYELGRMARETGQALDHVGLRALEKPIFKETCKSQVGCAVQIPLTPKLSCS